MVENYEETAGTSEFNMGIASLQRIHNLLQHIHEASIGISNLADNDKQQILQWQLLDRVYLEIKPYLKEAKKEGEKSEKQTVEDVRKAVESAFRQQKKTEYYNLLFTYEEEMRNSKWLKNMLMPQADEAVSSFKY